MICAASVTEPEPPSPSREPSCEPGPADSATTFSHDPELLDERELGLRCEAILHAIKQGEVYPCGASVPLSRGALLQEMDRVAFCASQDLYDHCMDIVTCASIQLEECRRFMRDLPFDDPVVIQLRGRVYVVVEALAQLCPQMVWQYRTLRRGEALLPQCRTFAALQRVDGTTMATLNCYVRFVGGMMELENKVGELVTAEMVQSPSTTPSAIPVQPRLLSPSPNKRKQSKVVSRSWLSFVALLFAFFVFMLWQQFVRGL
eukprot:TRINITY_DN4274_c0_g1_i2.p1 TRINITY_DN4274_c0_g1~~TRINITY_DN4274_c0_g1_i2.p1  ORF type:complete len:260 (+),score=41.02 TRINITY_DN4274_c0_g1_i2:668-1447(+)